MKRLLSLIACVPLACASIAVAQEKKPAPTTPPPAKTDAAKPDTKGADAAAAAQEAWKKAAEPGPMQKWLTQLEGEWTSEAKDTASGSEATDKGAMTSKMVMGGRFLQMEYDGRWHGKFFKGGGFLGYNNVDKRFESAWVDSGGSMISFMTGQADASGKVLTLTGEVTDPTTGKKAMMREVLTILGKDAHKTEFFIPADGKEMKIMEINYTRNAPAKKDSKEDKQPAKNGDKK